MDKVVKAAFQIWAQSQGFKPIAQQCRSELGTAVLIRRRGRFVVECHSALDPVQQQALIDCGALHGYDYPLGVEGLSASELLEAFESYNKS